MIKDEKGVGLIEVLIALAILGLVAVAFLSGLTTASRALIIADERTTAESLAKSQMEYVKQQPYEFAADDSQVEYEPISGIPAGYTICSISRAGTTASSTHPGYFISVDADPLHDPDDGIQKITVVVKHGDKEVITLEGYKVNR